MGNVTRAAFGFNRRAKHQDEADDSFSYQMFKLQEAIYAEPGRPARPRRADARAMTKAERDRRLTPDEKHLLVACSHFGRSGRGMFMSALTLAKRTGLHPETVRHMLEDLCTRGYLVPEAPRTRGKTSSYRYCDRWLAVLGSDAGLANPVLDGASSSPGLAEFQSRTGRSDLEPVIDRRERRRVADDGKVLFGSHNGEHLSAIDDGYLTWMLRMDDLAEADRALLDAEDERRRRRTCVPDADATRRYLAELRAAGEAARAERAAVAVPA